MRNKNIKINQLIIKAYRLDEKEAQTTISYRVGLYDDECGWGSLELAEKALLKYLREKRNEYEEAIKRIKYKD